VKITVMGSGNIGSLLGALLTEAGQDVTLVDIREDLIETIQKDGIRIDMSNGQSKHIKVKITKDVASVGISDLILIGVKGYATRGAMQNALPLVGKNTHVLSVQNGAGNIETIAEVLGSDSPVIGGVFHCIVTPLALNRLSWIVGTGGIKIGPMNGKMNAAIQKIADIFQSTGLDVVTSESVQDLIWSKLLLNTNMAVATVLKITNDEYLYYPSAEKLVRMIADECVKVCRAKGIHLEHPEDPVEPLFNIMKKFRDSGTKPKCSMYQDMENGRKTEIDTIHGSIVREGKKFNIPTPVTETLVLLVKAMEEKTIRNRNLEAQK
jgi:2-dehydropantoate 2-reductase